MTSDFTQPICRFEHLSNEVIYEIFDYLDFNDIHQSFVKLNKRFHDLVNSLAYPVRIDVSFMSKSTFQRYIGFLISYQNRITFFRSSSPLIDDLLSSTFTKMTQLRTLILENIRSKHLQDILVDLPSLRSLVIKTIGPISSTGDLFRQIFHLPALKYCHTTFPDNWPSCRLPFPTTNDYSPIETLVLNNALPMSELHILLSYVPDIRRLSYSIHQWSTYTTMQREPIKLSNLTHLFLHMARIFHSQMKLLMEQLFSHVRVVYITTLDSPLRLTTNKWEDMVISPLSNLHALHVKFTDDGARYLCWRDQQWCWTQEEQLQSISSVQPITQKCACTNRCSAMSSSYYLSVTQLALRNDISKIDNCVYFPYITKLTIFQYSNATNHSISAILDRIFPLMKLTELIINYPQFCVGKLAELLYFSPNVKKLAVHSISCHKVSSIAIGKSATLKTVSENSRIKDLIIENYGTFADIKLLGDLCPRTQQLTVVLSNSNASSCASLLTFLLEEQKSNTRRLCSLWLMNVSSRFNRILRSMVLSPGISVESTNDSIYYWW
ncbi:unnamed protein product [Adineta ricciae]|uniref:F-box domain-containing protein n=1 Tax=Adineta ricciae TaxID=249248 RepID=A0A816G8J5_ADIRI|nr:unnamed protein product [Adineta ricciae]